MRRLSSFAAIVVLAACTRGDSAAGDTSAAAAASANPDARAAEVSDAIASNPAAADSILAANGFTRESFERELFAIAADSSRSAAYAAAKAP